MVGSFLVALLYLKNFCLVFDLNVVPLALQNPFFDATIPLASSFCHLLFFSLFKKVQSPAEHPWLNRPIAMAIIGVGIFIPLHLVVLINFLKYQKFSWIEHMPRFVAVSTLPFIVLAAILILNFYLKFYSYLSEKNNEAI